MKEGVAILLAAIACKMKAFTVAQQAWQTISQAKPQPRASLLFTRRMSDSPEMRDKNSPAFFAGWSEWFWELSVFFSVLAGIGSWCMFVGHANLAVPAVTELSTTPNALFCAYYTIRHFPCQLRFSQYGSSTNFDHNLHGSWICQRSLGVKICKSVLTVRLLRGLSLC